MDINVLTSEKNIGKILLKYVSLNILSMLGMSFYILADTFFIANGVGANGLVALNLVLPVFSILNGVGIMLGVGGSTRYSIAVGAGDEKKADRIFTEVVIIGGIIGVLCTLGGTIFTAPICRLLGADEEIIALATTYLRTIASFSVPFILNHIVIAFIRNDKAPKLAMIAMLTSSLSNVFLDWILIYPCNTGIFGAAFATGLSPIFSLIILSYHFIRKRNNFKLIKTKLYFKDVRGFITTGAPSFVTEMSNGVIILVFNMVLLKIAGNNGVGAYSVIANLALVGVSIFNGIGQGAQPIISINYGAGKIKNVIKAWIYATVIALVIGVLMYIIFYFGRYGIIQIFNKDNITELTDIASDGVIWYSIAFFFTGINIVATSFFASISKSDRSFILSMLRGFLLPLPLVILLPKIININGVWLSVPFAEIITTLTAFVLTFMFIGKYKTEKTKNEKN